MIFTISRQEKVRRDAGASAPPGCISFKKKSLLFLLCWNASRESRREPSRKRLGLKLVIGKGRERKGKGRGGNGRKRKMAFHPNCFWRKKLYEFWDYFLDAGWQGAAKGAETFVLCSFRWPGRRSVGLRSTVTTPRDRVCACTDSGSLNNTENEDGVATICFTINYSRDGCWRRF
jgi:hypothetical protein